MANEQLSALQQRIQAATKLVKLDELKQRVVVLADMMNQADFWQNQKQAQTVSREYEDSKQEIAKWEEMLKRVSELVELSKDVSLTEEVIAQTAELEKEFATYEVQFLLDQPYDKNNAIIAIHAGSGGTEAQDWAEMLLRMLLRFAEKQNWKTRVIDESRGAEAGFKSVMFEVTGRHAFGYLKSEHGVHRLVRISPFDAEKMRHTSFASVEVLPEIDDTITIDIKAEDLRIDTFMSGGKGGQSVNTTYSAVRIVHLPTGITVQCQNERSQAQNKEVAMKVLQAKLLRLEEEKRAKERDDLRGERKSAEWGNQIRSYVLHPYHMINDHRTDYKSTDPESVLEGELLPLSEAYLKWIKT